MKFKVDIFTIEQKDKNYCVITRKIDNKISKKAIISCVDLKTILYNNFGNYILYCTN